MNRLSKLANKWKTDKGTAWEDSHGYTEFYQQFFEKYENPKIIEIGTYLGGSVHMLNEFFDGDCEIWALDWDEAAKPYLEDLPNVHFVQLDAGDKEGIERFRQEMADVEFDIIIDDASHIWQHQMNLVSGLHSLLKKDGIYIIEDIHFSRLFIDMDNSPLFFVNFLQPNIMLTEEENNELINKIDQVQIFSRKNNVGRMVEAYGGRSMTCVLTFEK